MTAQILPMHPGLPSEFCKPLDPVLPLEPEAAPTTMNQQEPAVDPASDEFRGRRRNRDSENGEQDGDNSGDADGSGATGSSRKRRRSRKVLDKKFECPHEGCGKSYSRAEHLYRHQLNHNPKQIYHCDFPDCHRSFVRQDLCARHKERHTARGSQLLRKDTFMHNLNPIVTSALASKNVAKGRPLKTEKTFIMQSPTSAVAGSSNAVSNFSPPLDPTLQSPASDPGALRVVNPLNQVKNNDAYRAPDGLSAQPRSAGGFGAPQRQQSFGPMSNGRPMGSPHMSADNSNNMTSPYGGTPTPTPTQPFSGPTSNPYPPQSPASYQNAQNYPQFSALPPPTYQTMAQPATSKDGEAVYPTPATSNMNSNASNTAMDAKMTNVSDAALLENLAPTYSVFGGEGYSRSPFAMADDFTAWLFNDSNFGPGTSPMGYSSTNNMANMVGSATIGLQAPYFNFDPLVSGYYSQPAPPHQPMSVNSIIDSSLPESALSEDKRQHIIDLIEQRFNETEHAPVRKQKEELLDGNRDDDSHVLSLRMMQTYVRSYWVHVHPQMPILHRPTFNPNRCSDLLLIAMMALGAACLDKSYGIEVTSQCSNLASFMAWHLRWEIFMDADFRPPAKLWVFQALLLLEIFEKLYSTRPLHERAHIHHATTLTLMRRGSSLIGRSATDSPPSIKDAKSGPGANGALSVQADEWWQHWITNEATRRAAFAAFVMDSIHATMFGHSAVMVAHEMRLPLPCDEALWSATSSAEVGRVEASLHTNGIKPTTFLDGLKKTLNGTSVRTNSFGRTILMAGLLSVSWHMNQRDLQVSSLGVAQALGGRDKWRGALTRAFDFWKQDFDASLAKTNDLAAPNAYQYSNGMDDENVFESRTVLHHLAHMAMHVDIVDCQIYAGATRLLGRAITPQDSNGAQRRMKETWAPTARARDATFYALRFLSQVLMPEDHGLPNPCPSPTGFDYSARDDFLLHRPWVVYFAVLIVWSYGYALDGPLHPVYSLPTHEDKIKDMQGFLRRVGGVRAPDDLVKVQNRNACLGLLVLMRDMFNETRWELLHEASKLLTKCIEMLTQAP